MNEAQCKGRLGLSLTPSRRSALPWARIVFKKVSVAARERFFPFTTREIGVKIVVVVGV